MKTKEKESPSQIKTFQARGKKVASTAITTTQQLLILVLSTSSVIVAVNKESDGGGKNKGEKLEDFNRDEHQDIYSYNRIVPES